MRFLIFIYGKSRMKRTQLVSDKRAECHILLPKDDFLFGKDMYFYSLKIYLENGLSRKQTVVI